MILSDEDAKLYFQLMWSLLHYVNQRLRVIPDISSVEEFALMDATDKVKVRHALLMEPKLIDDYVKENPQDLLPDELAIVSSWRHYVAGDFFIERHLAKHTIFIQEPHAYAVIGLNDPLPELMPRWRLPAYVKALLLPFRGRIIYDGLLESYNIMIGGGIRSSLKEVYLSAKQKGLIIESLEPDGLYKPKARAQPVDWRPQLDALLKDAQALRSGNAAPAIESATFSLVKTAVELAHSAVHTPDQLDALRTAFKKVERAMRKVNTVLDRAE